MAQDIESMAKNVLKEQQKELEDYRKEDHIYLVTEDTNGRIYISDQTENMGYEVEEVDIPNDLRGKISEGTTLKYENGEYRIVF